MTFGKRLVNLSALFVGIALVVAGCGKGDDQAKNKPSPKKGHDGWWCEEHGVPEEDCSLCLPDDVVKKRFIDKGDWCKIHERAQSQCFKCNPKLYEKFEAQYVAKFGEKPPRPPASEFRDDTKGKKAKEGKNNDKTVG